MTHSDNHNNKRKMKKKYIYLILTAFVFILCLKFGVFNFTEKYIKTYLYFKRNSFTISKFENGDKKVLLIPMVHLNTENYYQKVKHNIDSLRNDGYVFFYEGIGHKELNVNALETDMRKFRKITGYALMNYFDEENEADDALKIEGMVFQGNVDYGLNKNDINADYSLDELIRTYEENKGVISLDKCDLDTPLGKKYSCSETNSENSKFMLEDLRNEFLYTKLVDNDYSKIAVVYGAAHIRWLHLKLKHEGWQHFNQFHPDYRK